MGRGASVFCTETRVTVLGSVRVRVTPGECETGGIASPLSEVYVSAINHRPYPRGVQWRTESEGAPQH